MIPKWQLIWINQLIQVTWQSHDGHVTLLWCHMSLVLALPHYSGLEILALIEFPLLNHLRKNREHIHQFVVPNRTQKMRTTTNLCPINPTHYPCLKSDLGILLWTLDCIVLNFHGLLILQTLRIFNSFQKHYKKKFDMGHTVFTLWLCRWTTSRG